MRFTLFQASRQGGRPYNQDRVAYSYSRDALLMVVADGMGGHLHGEVAAQIAVQYLAEEFQNQALPSLIDPAGFLSRGLLHVHDAINDYSDRNNLMESPRTTCVACVVQDGVATWGHVGDSRLYLFRGARLLTRTRDHSAVQRLIDEGIITEMQALTHPDRNRVYSCLGGYIVPEVEVSESFSLQEDDTLLLCTDGLWSMLNAEEMLATLRAYSPGRALQHMMDHAEFRGGEGGDNLTALIMNWGRQAQLEAGPEISTEGLGLQEFTTGLARFEVSRDTPGADITDDDIERAIAEIQEAIRKHSEEHGE
jgi:serine/threonine protein phosphatase PrpC